MVRNIHHIIRINDVTVVAFCVPASRCMRADCPRRNVQLCMILLSFVIKDSAFQEGSDALYSLTECVFNKCHKCEQLLLHPSLGSCILCFPGGIESESARMVCLLL